MQVDAEVELIARARGGDLRAFGRLVDLHQAAVRGFLRRLVGNQADADDISQEAFARAWELLHRFGGASSLRTFICGIAYQFWRRNRRAFARRRTLEQDFAQIDQMQSLIAPSAEERLALGRAMDDLPPDQRAALSLCVGADFTHAEAATALGLALGTVKSHVARGRARLQAVLGIDPGKGSP